MKKITRRISAFFLALLIVFSGYVNMALANEGPKAEDPDEIDQELGEEIEDPSEGAEEEIDEEEKDFLPTTIRVVTYIRATPENDGDIVRLSEKGEVLNIREYNEYWVEIEGLGYSSKYILKNPFVNGLVKTDVFLREEASSSSQSLGILKEGEPIRYRYHTDYWLEIEGRGYAAAILLKDTYKTDHVQVSVIYRDRPSSNGKILGRLPLGQEIKYKLHNKYWIKIKDQGYASRIAIEKSWIDSKVENNSLARKTPTNDGEFVSYLNKGQAIKYREYNEWWIEIKDIGFASKYAIKSIYEDGFIRRNVLLRDRPGGQVLGTIKEGEKVKVKEYNDYWAEFDDGNVAALKYTSLYYDKLGIQGFTKSSAYYRTEKNSGDTIDGILPKGTYIDGVRQGAWVKFSWYGKTRYIAAFLIDEVDQEIGWTKKGNRTFYVDYTGYVNRGFREIGGSLYYFDPMFRYMYTGVKNTGRNIYYFNSDGKLSTGWKAIYGTSFNQGFKFPYPRQSDLNNHLLSRNEADFLGQAAANTSFDGMGTRYYWYGTDLKKGVYCSGLVYRAYIDNGLRIPGPEYGNEEGAKARGASYRGIRGLGPAGKYGYDMVQAQYLHTQDYTGGSRLEFESFYKLLPGDIFFACNHRWEDRPATHSAMYVGRLNGTPYTMHAVFSGCQLEPVWDVRRISGLTTSAYFQRPFK